MALLPVLFLLGTLFLCGCGAVHSTAIELLTQAALKWDRPLPCGVWDCDCAFNHQRGCCCAAGQVFELEDSIFERITQLWQDVSKLKYDIHELTDCRQVAFKATMDPNIAMLIAATTQHCFGPFNTNVPIPYSNVTLNDANGFNPALGVFTAPCAGVYIFSFTVYSHVEQKGRLYHKVQLMRNGVLIASIWENNREDIEDSGNQVVVLELQRGDQVYIELMSGRMLCDQLQYNIFTGYMLYTQDTDEHED